MRTIVDMKYENADEALVLYAQVLAIEEPSARILEAFTKWMNQDGHPARRPLIDVADGFLEEPPDLAALTGTYGRRDILSNFVRDHFGALYKVGAFNSSQQRTDTLSIGESARFRLPVQSRLLLLGVQDQSPVGLHRGFSCCLLVDRSDYQSLPCTQQRAKAWFGMHIHGAVRGWTIPDDKWSERGDLWGNCGVCSDPIMVREAAC